MTPPNGLTYSDQRVLVALARLLAGRDQVANPITQAEIARDAIVSLRSVHDALTRLSIERQLVIIADRRQGSPATYALSPEGQEIANEHLAPCP